VRPHTKLSSKLQESPKKKALKEQFHEIFTPITRPSPRTWRAMCSGSNLIWLGKKKEEKYILNWGGWKYYKSIDEFIVMKKLCVPFTKGMYHGPMTTMMLELIINCMHYKIWRLQKFLSHAHHQSVATELINWSWTHHNISWRSSLNSYLPVLLDQSLTTVILSVLQVL